MKRQIVWEPYLDPVQKEQDEVDTDYQAEDPEYENGSVSEIVVHHIGIDGHSLDPGGQASITDLYNVWIGHTSFRLTNDHIALIQAVDGVENFRYITDYRFMIAFGRLFKSDGVKKNIQILLYEADDQIQQGVEEINRIIEELTIIPEEVQNKIDSLKKEMKKHDEWAIFVFPNGEISHSDSSKPDFTTKLEEYIQLKQDIQGILVTSYE